MGYITFNPNGESKVYHVPMCVMCGEYEVGTFQAHNEFCSDKCADAAHDAFEVDKFYEGWTEDEADYHADWRDEQRQDDLSDDGDALASAGFGTDEDYGYYGEE